MAYVIKHINIVNFASDGETLLTDNRMAEYTIEDDVNPKISWIGKLELDPIDITDDTWFDDVVQQVKDAEEMS